MANLNRFYINIKNAITNNITFFSKNFGII